MTPWLPMFMFVLLFGPSMDYHVFIISRACGFSRRHRGCLRTPQPQCAKDRCSRFQARGVKYCREHQELEAVPF